MEGQATITSTSDGPLERSEAVTDQDATVLGHVLIGRDGRQILDRIARHLDRQMLLMLYASGSSAPAGDHLHHAGLGELLDSLSHSGLAQANYLADFGVRLSAIVLQLLDDLL